MNYLLKRPKKIKHPQKDEEEAPVKKINSRVSKNASDSPILTKSKRSISVDESPNTKQSTAVESGPLTHATKDRPKMSGRRPPTRGTRAQTIADTPSTTTTTTQSKTSNSTQSKNTKKSTKNADDLLAAIESSTTEDDSESGSTNKSQKSNIDPTSIFSSTKNDPAHFVFGGSGTNSSLANSDNSTVDDILGGGSKKSNKKVSSFADDILGVTNKSSDNEIFDDPLKPKKKKKEEKEKPVLESPSIFGDPLVGSKKKTNKS